MVIPDPKRGASPRARAREFAGMRAETRAVLAHSRAGARLAGLHPCPRYPVRGHHTASRPSTPRPKGIVGRTYALVAVRMGGVLSLSWKENGAIPSTSRLEVRTTPTKQALVTTGGSLVLAELRLVEVLRVGSQEPFPGPLSALILPPTWRRWAKSLPAACTGALIKSELDRGTGATRPGSCCAQGQRRRNPGGWMSRRGRARTRRQHR
jgi:hypothetical protein